jgi:ATP-dependent protease ClpP protease subunit
MKSWFRFQNVSDDPTVAEIYIIDFIGGWIDEALREWYGDSLTGVTAKQFVKDLAALPEAVQTIRVHINSPGGDVFGAVNIANALREQQASKGRTVETIVDGLAASAASIVAMAGSTVCMADNALMMIHAPWIVAIGNASEMRKTADTLDAIQNTIVATYQWHSPLKAEEIVALIDAETWMDADEALANGFATEKVEGLKAAACLDAGSLAKLSVPAKFKDRIQAWVKTPPEAPKAAAPADVLRLCREGECLDLAEALIAENATADQVQARVTTEKTTRAAAKARTDAITAACAKAKLPNLAAGYIAGAMSVDAVKAHLTEITARIDHIEIDGRLEPDRGAAETAAGWKTAVDRASRRLGARK